MAKKYYLIANKIFGIFLLNPVFFLKRIFIEFKFFIFPVPKNRVSKRINGVLFDFDFDYSDRIKKMYMGAYESTVAEVLKKNLREGDTFIDVGASIGYLTAVAAGLVGKSGKVYSFEPVKEYFQKLKYLAEANKDYNIITNCFALGSEEKSDKIYIKGFPDIGYNTFFPGLLDGDKNKKTGTEEVAVRRLDKYIEEKKIDNIKLIKIDVEGFEFSVLQGLSGYLSKCVQRGYGPMIICEIVPDAYSISGHKLEELFDYMNKFFYSPFNIINPRKPINLDQIKKEKVVDVIFKFCK